LGLSGTVSFSSGAGSMTRLPTGVFGHKYTARMTNAGIPKTLINNSATPSPVLYMKPVTIDAITADNDRNVSIP